MSGVRSATSSDPEALPQAPRLKAIGHLGWLPRSWLACKPLKLFASRKEGYL